MAKGSEKNRFEENEFFKNLPPKTQEEILEQKRKEEEACLKREKLLRKIMLTGTIAGALLAALCAVMNGNDINLMVFVCALYGAIVGFVIARFSLNHVYATLLFGLPLLMLNLFCLWFGFMNTIFVTLVLYPAAGMLIPFILEKLYQELEPF